MKLLKIIIEDVALFDKKIEIDFFSEARVSLKNLKNKIQI